MLLGSPPDMIRGYPLRETGPAAIGGGRVHQSILLQIPPLGNRYFDISTLLPYSVPASNILTYEIHTLWLLLLEMYKSDNTSVELDASSRELMIEE